MLISCDDSVAVSEHLLHQGSCYQAFHPSIVIWALFGKVEVVAFHEILRRLCPRNKTQICVSAFTTNKVTVSVLLQNRIQDFAHALRFILIAFNCRGYLLWMKVDEPRSLTKVRPLTGHLEMEELLEMVFLRHGGDVQLRVFIIHVNKIFDNRARLPQRYASVGIFDGRYTVEIQKQSLCRIMIEMTLPAIRILLDVRGTLDGADEFHFVFNLKFFEDDYYLPRIGTGRGMAVKNNGLRHGCD